MPGRAPRSGPGRFCLPAGRRLVVAAAGPGGPWWSYDRGDHGDHQSPRTGSRRRPDLDQAHGSGGPRHSPGPARRNSRLGGSRHGSRHGRGPVRLHADPAAHDRQGRALDAVGRRDRDRQLRRLSGGCDRRCRRARVAAVASGVPRVADRRGHHARTDAGIAWRHEVGGTAVRRRMCERADIHGCGERAAHWAARPG